MDASNGGGRSSPVGCDGRLPEFAGYSDSYAIGSGAGPSVLRAAEWLAGEDARLRCVLSTASLASWNLRIAAFSSAADMYCGPILGTDALAGGGDLLGALDEELCWFGGGTLLDLFREDMASMYMRAAGEAACGVSIVGTFRGCGAGAGGGE